EHPDVHIVLDEANIEFQKERAFKGEYDNEAAIQTLNSLLTAHVIGVELKVDDKLVASLKDEEEAKQVLEEFKDMYSGTKKKQSKVTILSAPEDQPEATPEIRETKSIEFTQDVKIEPIA